MPAILNNDKLLPFNLSNPLAMMLLIVVFNLTACGSHNEAPAASSTQGDNVSFKIPDSILASRLDQSAGTLTATISVSTLNGGAPQAMTLSATDASATLDNIPVGEATIVIVFTYDLSPFGPLVVASATRTVTVGAGDNPISFVEADYDTASFDEDGDGISNLDELDETSTTSPLAPASSVTAELPGNLDQTAGTLTATLSGNGGTPQAMTVSATDANVTVNDIPLGAATITIEFTYDRSPFGPLVVASATKAVTVVAGTNSFSFVNADYDSASFDEDGDGLSNLTELDATSTSNPLIRPTIVTAQLPERLGGSEAGLRADLAIDGGTAQALTVSGNQATTEVELADGAHDFVVSWLANDGTLTTDLELAAATTNVTIGDPVFTADIAADGYSYTNSDADLFSNLAEFRAASDANDAGDTPVNSRIVVPGALETAGVTELYGSDMNGTRIKLSPTLQPNGAVSTTFVVSPDGRYAALTADATDDGINDVYVVPVDGSSPAVKVSSVGFVIVPGTTFVSASSLTWAPDSSRIAWLGDFRADNVTELFSATPTGAQQAVNGPMVLNGDVFNFAWSPDSSRLAYRADEDTDVVNELYTAFPDGTGRLKVSGTMVLNGDLSTFRWSPDGSRLAYVADQSVDTRNELFTADPAVGASAVRVSLPVLGSNLEADVSTNITWSPDSSRIAYTHDRDIDGVNDLYTTVPDSAAQVFKVNNTSLTAGQFQSISFAWSPDSSLLAYRGDVETDNVNELFIDTFDSQRTSPKVSGTLVGLGGVSQFQWSPDGSQLVFTADADIDNIFELFSVASAEGSPRLELSPSAVTTVNVSVNIFQFTADGSRVVFRAMHDLENVNDLFSATPGVADSAVNLSQLTVPPPPGGTSGGSVAISTFSPFLSPDSRSVFYAESTFFNDGINPVTSRSNVHSAPVDGSGSIVDLIDETTVATGGTPFTNSWTLAGERATFVHDSDSSDLIGLELFSNKADGSALINHTAPVVDSGAQTNFAQNAGEFPETEDNDTALRAEVLPFPVPVAGATTGDDDFFSFTAPVSGSFEFQLSTTDTVSMEILDTDGVTVLSSGAKLLRPSLVANSRYFIKLSGSGNYRFTFGQQAINN